MERYLQWLVVSRLHGMNDEEMGLILQKLLLFKPYIGAVNQLWAATCPLDQARELGGQYVVPFRHIGRPRQDLNDPEKWEQLWKWCETETKKHV